MTQDKPRGVETEGRTIELSLPFPVKVLWPNGRPGHWGVKARAAKAARRLAGGEALVARGAPLNWSGATLAWTIHPKTAHAIDDDAPPSALKAYRDGIADALGLDDQHFTATYRMGQPVKGGAVTVIISETK